MREVKLMPKKADLSFEQAQEQLEGIVDRLESGNLTLTEAMEAYEQGVRLAAHCNRLLNDCAGRITVLKRESEGMIEMPFEAEEITADEE